MRITTLALASLLAFGFASRAEAQMTQQQINSLAFAAGLATPTPGGAVLPIGEGLRSLLSANGVNLPPPPQPPVYMPFVAPFNCANGYVTVGNAIVCN